VELDHVVIAVADLAAAADELVRHHGLVSSEGGRHPGWGTANRIVPLGETYLELIAVVDADEAAASEFGRWVASSGGEAMRLLGWAVRTEELDGVATRLGLTIRAGSRATPDGSFFLEWGGGTYPGRSAAPAPASITRIVVRDDGNRLAAWLGEHTLPLVVEPGPPALAQVVLAAPAGEIVLGG
jgi:hypothetical protein